jgi:hypothetical protein
MAAVAAVAVLVITRREQGGAVLAYMVETAGQGHLIVITERQELNRAAVAVVQNLGTLVPVQMVNA